mgnify:CR=1 FL=1
METQTKYQPRVEKIERVWVPDAKLWTPHNSGETAFASPAFGPNNYRDVGQEIISKKLSVPTGDYTASLLHSAYCSDVTNEQEFKNVRDIMRSNWLWIFDKNLWTDKGVYVLQDLKATGRSQPLTINNLEKALKNGKEINGLRFSKERHVRFAPKGSYNLGDTTHEALTKDGFIIASCGAEGAEKLGEVSSQFKNKPSIFGLDIQEEQEPELRVSAVGGGGGWLWFLGYWAGGGGSHAFGVF